MGRADDGLRLFKIAKSLHAFLSNDPHRRLGQKVDEPCMGLLERKLDRVSVRDIDTLDRLGGGSIRIRLESKEAIVCVRRGEFATIQKRLGVPANAPFQSEDIGDGIRSFPRFR